MINNMKRKTIVTTLVFCLIFLWLFEYNRSNNTIYKNINENWGIHSHPETDSWILYYKKKPLLSNDIIILCDGLYVDNNKHLVYIKYGTSPPPYVYYKVYLRDSIKQELNWDDTVEIDGKIQSVNSIPYISPQKF